MDSLKLLCRNCNHQGVHVTLKVVAVCFGFLLTSPNQFFCDDFFWLIIVSVAVTTENEIDIGTNNYVLTIVLI